MKSKLLPLVYLLTFLLGYVDSNGRIYGGYQIDITKAPYVVHIDIFTTSASAGIKMIDCGGTILRTNLILTAAHCNADETDNKPYDAESFFVFVGTNTRMLTGGGGTMHVVKTVFVHPKYKGGGDNHYFHDVGLLELRNYITLSARAQLVQLALPTDRPAEGTDCTITGYGDNPDHPGDKRLYQVHLKVITAEQCVNELALGTVKEVDQHEICVKVPGKNQCNGDSGGPLHDVSTNRQVGIVSYGGKNCTQGKPGVLSRVTDNLDFIDEIINKMAEQSSYYNPIETSLMAQSFSMLDVFMSALLPSS